MKFQLTIRGVNYSHIYSSVPKGWRLEENNRKFSLVFEFEAENPEAAQVKLIEEIGKAKFGRNNRKAFYLPLLKPQKETPTQRHQREEYEYALKQNESTPATGELIWFSDPQPIDMKLLMDQQDALEIERQKTERRTKFEKLAAAVKELSEKPPADLDLALENIELPELKLPPVPVPLPDQTQQDNGWSWNYETTTDDVVLPNSDVVLRSHTQDQIDAVEKLHELYNKQVEWNSNHNPQAAAMQAFVNPRQLPRGWTTDMILGQAFSRPNLHEEAQKILQDEYFDTAIPANEHLFAYLLPCISKDRLERMMALDDRVFRYVVRNARYFKPFSEVCDSIIRHGMNQRMCKKIRRAFAEDQGLATAVVQFRRGW